MIRTDSPSASIAATITSAIPRLTRVRRINQTMMGDGMIVIKPIKNITLAIVTRNKIGLAIVNGRCPVLISDCSATPDTATVAAARHAMTQAPMGGSMRLHHQGAGS